MRTLVEQSQTSVQASVEAIFRQYMGSMQAPAARPLVAAALGAPPPTQPSALGHPETPVALGPPDPTKQLLPLEHNIQRWRPAEQQLDYQAEHQLGSTTTKWAPSKTQGQPHTETLRPVVVSSDGEMDVEEGPAQDRAGPDTPPAIKTTEIAKSPVLLLWIRLTI